MHIHEKLIQCDTHDVVVFRASCRHRLTAAHSSVRRPTSRVVLQLHYHSQRITCRAGDLITTKNTCVTPTIRLLFDYPFVMFVIIRSWLRNQFAPVVTPPKKTPAMSPALAIKQTINTHQVNPMTARFGGPVPITHNHRKWFCERGLVLIARARRILRTQT